MRMGLLLAPLTSLLLLLGAAPKDSPGQQPAGGRKAHPDALREAAMNTDGDGRRGKALFASPRTNCASCHKVQGQGGDVGPDLSQVGGKFDRTHLIESILDPSAEITQGYHATVIETRSGRVFTGIVKSESPTALTLLD